MSAARKTSRLPIVLSALVYPGAGQMVQRRWAAGLIYMLSFTVFFVMMTINVLGPLYEMLNAVLNFAETGTGDPLAAISPTRILVPFGLSMLIYVANLFDVARAARRPMPQ